MLARGGRGLSGRIESEIKMLAGVITSSSGLRLCG